MSQIILETLDRMLGVPESIFLIRKIDDALGDIYTTQEDFHIDHKMSRLDDISEYGSFYKFPFKSTLEELESNDNELKKQFDQIPKLFGVENNDALLDIDDNQLTKLVEPLQTKCVHFNQLSSDDNCMICLSPFEDTIIMFICGHYLCQSCYKEVLRKWPCYQYGNCPYCRKMVTDLEKIEFKQSDSTIGLDTQLVNLIVNEQINRKLIEFTQWNQECADISVSFTNGLKLYINQMEMADRTRLLEVENSAYQQILDGHKMLITLTITNGTQLSDFVRLWNGNDQFHCNSYSYSNCFEEISSKIEHLLIHKWKMIDEKIYFDFKYDLIGWFTYQIIKNTDKFDQWIEWLRLHVNHVPIYSDFCDSNTYKYWNDLNTLRCHHFLKCTPATLNMLIAEIKLAVGQ